MNRLFFGIAVVVVLLAAGPAAAATLRLPDARTEARLAAFDFGTRHHMDSSNVGRCRRRSPSLVSCVATVKGETAAMTKVCELRITVRAIDHRYYTSEAAAITHHRCSSTPKERLTYSAALAAIQAKADEFAGTATTIDAMYRDDELTYSARARWERPRSHPNEFLPTESCSVELKATLAAGQISTEAEGFSCF
jgi:hypothetical protein